MIKLNDKPVVLEKFRDGTLKCSLEGTRKYSDTVNVIRWFYEGDDEIFALYALVNELRDRGIGGIRLELPYIPNARQDRRDNKDRMSEL